MLLLALGAAAVLALGTGPAAATVVNAGLSGQCYDQAGNGGQDELRVVVDTASPASPSVTMLTVTGTASALSQFAVGTVDQYVLGNPTACMNSDTLDYLEVGASVDGTQVQVCYNGGVGLGGCPTSPAGPGSPG